MHDHQFTRTIFTDRRREMERNLQHRMTVTPRGPSRIRRNFGRRLIHIGRVLAAEGPLQPAAR